MKKVLLITSCLLYIVLSAMAQKEANIWYFGQRAGLDFNGGAPVSITNGALVTNEGCATICDKNGSLLFYTDGIKVWNRNHVQMTNGFGMLGDPSTAQSAIIVPKPGNKDMFYIFTLAAEGKPGGFCYSEVDITLNGGLGDVIAATKNTQLFTPATEKVTAVRHANGLFMWVIAHGLNNNSYQTYLVDCNGVNPPVISNVGQVEGPPGWGYLVASPNGKRLGSAMRVNGYEVTDFDNATGIVSNPIALGQGNASYGIAFSPDGNVLYGTQLNSGNIYQWNLQAGNAAAIIASVTLLGIAPGTSSPYRGGALQLGPDKKIYMTQYNQAFLSVINNPNVVGTGCNLQNNAVNLQGRASVLGLPGLIQSYFDSPVVINHTNDCLGTPTKFSIGGANSLDSTRWYFGDPLSGAQNTSADTAPAHQFSAVGNFSVMVIRYASCISDTAYATVNIKPSTIVRLGNDTSLCADTLMLRSSVVYGQPRYQWTTGANDTLPTKTVNKSGTYILQVTDTGSCIGIDTIDVVLYAHIAADLGPDRVICNSDVTTLYSPQPPGTQHIWSTGLTADSIQVSQSGSYWLHLDFMGCTGADTVNVTVIEKPKIHAGDDDIICDGTSVRIGTVVPEATYSWSNDSTTAFITVAATGDYILTVKLGPCVVKDTVSVTVVPNPSINLGIDTDICPRQIIVLNANDPEYKHIWNTGDTTTTINVTAAGKYWAQVITPYGCIKSDTILLKRYELPTVILSDDTVVCAETPLLLKPLLVINHDSLEWFDGSSKTVADALPVAKGATYYVSAINKCGLVHDTIDIRQVFCDVWLPNAFTPDGDGKNDVFRVRGNIIRMQDFSFSIYNRWGEQVFTTTDKNAGWDGTYKGLPCGIDTYLYMFQYTFDGIPGTQKGDVILIR